MKINKPLNIDLNIISPQKHIRIHEGDVDSVDILIGVSVDDESVDLTGVTIKYDATINNYLAEQDADGSVVNGKISIPVTQNMTAMSGLLLIDVRMIQNDQILFTQTICATVEKAVVNGSTYIDFDKITIIQRMNALEEKMDYIEELVENFDTSKLIVSVNRPPMGAPVEVDVDLLRVGDTWILSSANIVYKLVEAQYNYSPAPGVEPQHYFTWQTLNERYGVGNIDPPTTVTYQPVIYTINEVQWSWLPVPEYFRGDHYQKSVGLEEPTYYICKSASMPSTGVCTYIWREEGGGASSGITIINTETVPESAEWGDSIPASYAGNTGKAGEIAYWEESGYFWGLCSLAKDPMTGNINYNWVQQADEIDIDDLKSVIATKMKLAPINPAAQEIEDMPSGQLYGDITNHKGIIKGAQEFYDTVYMDNNYRKTIINSRFRPPCNTPNNQTGFKVGDIWITTKTNSVRLYKLAQTTYNDSIGYIHYWVAETPTCHYIYNSAALPTQIVPEHVIYGNPNYYSAYEQPQYSMGDYICRRDNNTQTIALYICVSAKIQRSGTSCVVNYVWEEVNIPYNTYTKTEIDQKGYLTIETLPIYDGTVI